MDREDAFASAATSQYSSSGTKIEIVFLGPFIIILTPLYFTLI